MIPSINFIEKHRFRFTYRNILTLGVLLAAILGGGWLWSTASIRALNQESEALQQSVEQLAKTLKLGETETKKEGEMNAVTTLYESLRHSPKWSLVLGELWTAEPRGLTLTAIEKKEEASLTVRGESSQPHLLTGFVDALKASSTISEVHLISTATKAAGKKNTISFEIELLLKGAS